MRSSSKRWRKRQAAVRDELDAFIFPILSLPACNHGRDISLLQRVVTSQLFTFRWKQHFDFSQFVRTWRTVALSIPALWAALHITVASYGNFDVFEPEQIAEIVDTWFGRAGTLPLSLRWLGGVRTEKRWSEAMNAILRRWGPRLELLDIYAGEDCVSSLPDGITFSYLEKLFLQSTDTAWGADVELIDGAAFSEAPRLRHLSLESVSVSSLILPWKSLESFTITGNSPWDCLDILQMSPSLRKVKVDIIASPFSHDGSIVSHVRVTSALNRHHDKEFLPALANLTLQDWKADQVDAPLLDALKTRGVGSETEDGRAARLPLKSFRSWMSPDASGLVVRRHGIALQDLQSVWLVQSYGDYQSPILIKEPPSFFFFELELGNLLSAPPYTPSDQQYQAQNGFAQVLKNAIGHRAKRESQEHGFEKAFGIKAREEGESAETCKLRSEPFF
ncbi:hypothetical protein C8F04DRAFT_1231002 [Mycena alexandri]|uniref:Uncharacterized protein n=1 Tax=Mycena alexandri TaxID=1745969 RepID=A0AAD6T6L0_9AGAR|nr:hypothetical protein C8F04DRAFT_1231002 [Mycena alexandri]